VGRGGNVLLLSMRRIADLVAYSMLYEFEDIIAEATDADRADVESPAALEFSRRTYRVARMISRSCSLASLVAPTPSIVRLERKYELFFPTFNHTHELYALATIPDWRDHCRKAACYINEVWMHLLPPYLLELLNQFDHVFLGTRHCVERVGEMIKAPCSHLPLAADVLRFAPWPHPPQRAIDVCNIGRRSSITHRALLEMAEARKIYYYYDTFAAPFGSRQRTFHVSNASEHRLMLGGLLQRSRYYVANRARVNEPEHTGDREEMSGRFYEGAAAGAVMIGEAPKTDDFRDQFGWPDAVIPMPFDCPNVETVLEQLGRDPERLARISRLNVHYAAIKHDWLHRLQHVFETLSLPPTVGMLERQRRLSQVADWATAPQASAA